MSLSENSDFDLIFNSLEYVSRCCDTHIQVISIALSLIIQAQNDHFSVSMSRLRNVSLLRCYRCSLFLPFQCGYGF